MITLEANYSKKICLPGYSSHQFSVTLKSELADVAPAEQESTRLYCVLQSSEHHQHSSHQHHGGGRGSAVLT
jgi:hypothetical protein